MPESNISLSKQLKELTSLYSSDPRARTLMLWTAGLTTVLTSAGIFSVTRAARSFRRIPNADWFDPGILTARPLLRGVVTRVGDADNFRFYHTPGLFWHWPLKLRRVPATAKGTEIVEYLFEKKLMRCSDLTNETIHIRINAVDAPECAHFGREAQPHSAEALDWLKSRLLGKTIFCRPLRRDHHGRIVAACYLPPRFLPNNLFKGKHLSMEMLKSGWATVYEQGGAEYHPYTKEAFLRTEATARTARKGIWVKGKLAETPAEYKKRHTAAEALNK